MKTYKEFKRISFIGFLIGIFILLFQNCTSDNQKTDTYNDLLKFTDGIKVINTHEHQRRPDEFGLDSVGFYHLLHQTYLFQDVVSSGMQQLNIQTKVQIKN